MHQLLGNKGKDGEVERGGSLVMKRNWVTKGRGGCMFALKLNIYISQAHCLNLNEKILPVYLIIDGKRATTP